MRKLTISCIAAASLFAAMSAKADNLVIWAPEKTSDHSYKATLGFRLPMEWEPSAGADVALSTTKGGVPVPDSEQATLWGRISKVNATPAGQSQRDLSLRVDTLRGDSTIAVSGSQSWIVNDSLDMKATRSLSFDYHAAEERRGSVIASQALTLSHAWTGTSISAGGSFTDLGNDFSSSVGLNQQILPNLNFNATVTDPMSASEASNLSMNYQLNW